MIRLLQALLCASCCFAQETTEQRLQARQRDFYRQRAVERAARPDVLNDPALLTYLSLVTAKLTAQCPAVPLMGVRLIDSDEINAFAMPEGFLFVHTGLLRKADSEAELAAVLAQAIAHSAAPPLSSKRNASGPPVVFVYDRSYAPGPAVAIPMGLAGEARALVPPADRTGITCAAASGYDPEPFVDNLQKLPSNTAPTHPPASERIEQARRTIAGIEPRSDYVVTTHDFDEAKKRAGQLDSAARRRAGFPPSLYR